MERWSKGSNSVQSRLQVLSAHAPLLIGYKSLPSFGEADDHYFTLLASSGATNYRISQLMQDWANPPK